jgi:DNA-binding transcriptional LysR family regulator
MTFDEALALTRRVVLTVPYFGTVFAVVASTDCLAAVSRRQAEHHARSLPLRVVEIPVPLRLQVSMHWHVRSEADAAVLALRTMVREVLRPYAWRFFRTRRDE